MIAWYMAQNSVESIGGEKIKYFMRQWYPIIKYKKSKKLCVKIWWVEIRLSSLSTSIKFSTIWFWLTNRLILF